MLAFVIPPAPPESDAAGLLCLLSLYVLVTIPVLYGLHRFYGRSRRLRPFARQRLLTIAALSAGLLPVGVGLYALTSIPYDISFFLPVGLFVGFFGVALGIWRISVWGHFGHPETLALALPSALIAGAGLSGVVLHPLGHADVGLSLAMPLLAGLFVAPVIVPLLVLEMIYLALTRPPPNPDSAEAFDVT